MPPAAKKKKLKQTTVAGGESRVVRDAVTRCKRSGEYAETLRAMTFVTARKINRLIGTPKWYRLNKDALVSLLVIHRCALRIQKFFRMAHELQNGTRAGSGCGSGNGSGSGGASDSSNSNSSKKRKVGDHDRADDVCPISLVPMSEIPRNLRFAHANTWFDRGVLAQHMSKTSDFVNPVTRVDFCEEDIMRIDPGLVEQFQNRKELRSAIAHDMAMVQSMENEMEEVFQNMVEAAEVIRSRMEFRLVFDSLSEDFQECHDDLVELDLDRSNLAMKSLYDLITGDPNNPVRMSRKRENILRHFLDSQA
ncbi:unnamed protein product [Ectocarpus sp. 12 AP-2014]